LSDLDKVQWLINRDVKVSSVEFGLELDEQNDIQVLQIPRRFSPPVHFIGTNKTQEMSLTATFCHSLIKLSVTNAELTSAYTNLLYCNPYIQHLVCDDVDCKESDLFEGLQLHKLCTIRLDCYEADDSAGCLWHKTAHSASLHTVVWEGCSFDDDDWLALISNCPRLRSFTWSYASETNENKCLLADNASILTRLINLSCYRNATLTDAAVLTISKSLTSLRTLNIQKCANLTDLTLLNLAEYSGATLEVLYVDIHNPESKETVQILEIFSTECTKLTYLNIDCREKMLCAGRGTSLLVRGCPALRTLVVDKHETICESSRDFIATMRPDLKLLVHDATTEFDIMSVPI